MLLKLDRETVYLADLIKHFDPTIRLDDCLMYITYSCRDKHESEELLGECRAAWSESDCSSVPLSCANWLRIL